MKPHATAKDIVPMSEFKARASELFRRLREEQRPVIITQNGKPAGVLITPEEFDRIQELDRFTGAVSEGLADAAADRLTDDEAFGSQLDEAFGPLE